MKNNKLVLIIGLIILILVAVWLVFLNDKKENVEEQISVESECIESGGQWTSGECIVYDEERAQELKKSCLQVGGDWVEDSYKYECSFDGDVFAKGSWRNVNWIRYDELKESCLDEGGDYIGGVDMKCEIDGEVYSRGSWEDLDYMKAVCEGYKGQWIGGTEYKCELQDKIYTGDLVKAFGLKKSCDEYPGIWLGGEESACKVGPYTYKYGSWELIEEMEDSCLEYGGEYLGGTDYRCEVYGDVYSNKEWIRFSKEEPVQEKCQNDGGNWIEEEKTCQGLPIDWCMDVEQEYDEIKGLRWDDTTLSCSLIM